MISRLLLPGFASGAPCYVLLGATISAHPSQTDHVQRTVGLAVPTAVETMPDNLARGSFDGRDTAEAGQGSLATQPLGVVSGNHQERRGVVSADARQRDQLRGDLRHQPVEVRLQLGDLLRERAS
jgi:hypothetical protein